MRPSNVVQLDTSSRRLFEKTWYTLTTTVTARINRQNTWHLPTTSALYVTGFSLMRRCDMTQFDSGHLQKNGRSKERLRDESVYIMTAFFRRLSPHFSRRPLSFRRTKELPITKGHPRRGRLSLEKQAAPEGEGCGEAQWPRRAQMFRSIRQGSK